LVRAEKQAREAEIQLALERVRARSLAMHHTSELQDVVNIAAQQLHGIGMDINGGVFICINAEIDNQLSIWASGGMADYAHKVVAPVLDKPIFTQIMEAMKKGESFLIEKFSDDEKRELFAHLFQYEPWKSLPTERKEELMSRQGGFARSVTISHYTSISITNHYGIAYTDEENEVLKRFGKVFEQSYVRFLDLQKAEAQAKEAQVEAALERVRSKTMAMHNSNDVGESVATLFDELTALGLLSLLDRCGIGIMQPNKMMELWTAEKGTGKTELTIGHLNMQLHIALKNVYQNWLDKKETFQYILEGEDKFKYYEAIRNQAKYKIRKDYYSSHERIVHTDFFFNEGCLFVFSQNEFSTEATSIFIRFAKVFGQTYRRYLDLQKAEAQAREAQIENALEKVRSRSLAMQNPEELTEVAQLLREEMGNLGVEALETSSIYIFDENTGLTQCWFTIKNSGNSPKAVTDQMTLDLQDTWVGRQMLDFYRSPEIQTSILMQGENRKAWIRYCEEKSELFGTSNFYGEIIPERTYHLYKFSNGFIGAAAPGDISRESWDLLKRATAVFSLAYTRFQDLQRAEASAIAALRQASLDRIRADISSMRNADDLDRITPLIFNELTVLGVPFIRCGVFIIQEKQKIVEAYLSSPEGNSLGVLRLPFEASQHTYETVKAWRKGEVYRQHWNKEDFVQWIESLMAGDQIQDSHTYQGASLPPESLHLHFVPFTQGMLYVGSTEPLSMDEIDLINALSKAFAIAYSRYEDFVKLEQAKAEIESAMKELKATQSQLIQAEKMASLGELTAGIAHEIQNPLNFVNNFSEVSKELIDEVKSERAKVKGERDKELEEELLNDIASNLDKINHHGKRADAIVKGMLAHSRTSSGKKEPTDLTALCDEYLRLAYHGLKAKDAAFAATFQFIPDKNLPEVSVVSHEIGRVLLNLLNNAFYAVNERSKKGEPGYTPEVILKTATAGRHVQISVEDNGGGIPESIREKIFQPFFTTKPTGEGTGLGLSLSYDIVIAHGGKLKVETKEGEGSEFIIQLSI
jgi:signal transduction histidine kinase